MQKIPVPPSLERLVRLLKARPVVSGGAIALAMGIGLGAWLQPPALHYGSTTTTVVTPPEQSNVWGEDATSVSTAPYAQPETGAATVQTAAVSPPAGGGPSDWPDTARVQPAVQSTAVSQASPDDAGQTSGQASETQGRSQQVAYNARPQPPHSEGRDWAADSDAYGRAVGDDADPPPPARWQRPPDRRWAPEPRPPMQDRRWDFRPDGSAIPSDEGDGGG